MCACGEVEIWLPVPVLELVDAYEISSHGRVRSKTRRAGFAIILGQPIQPRWHRGYGYLRLWRKRRRFVFRLHRLVAFAFLAAPADYEDQVNHRDGDRAHNCAANLEWLHGAANLGDRDRRHGWGVYSKQSCNDDAAPIGRGAGSSSESSPSAAPSSPGDGPTYSFSPSILS